MEVLILDIAKKNKQTYYEFTRSLMGMNQENYKEIISRYIHPDIDWRGPSPLHDLKGIDAYMDTFFTPFLKAFPDLEKNPYVLLSGVVDGEEWVSATGYYKMTFTKPWLDIPCNGRPVFLRFGEWHQFRDGKIIKSYVILDILDLIRSAGIDLGIQGWANADLALGPATQDGIWIDEDAEAERETLAAVDGMISAMREFDGKDLDTMHQWDFWDAEHMIWAGPCGIGQTRGLKGYQNYHQRPWLEAFPDRTTHGNLNMVPIVTEGHYTCLGAWNDGENIYATHTGGDLFGLAATGKPIKVRDVDWYRIENGKIVENWCMIDIIYLLEQLGIDIFARMKKRLNTEI